VGASAGPSLRWFRHRFGPDLPHNTPVHDIFLSYRRKDSGPYTAWLYSHLNRRFPGRVFFDVKRIDAGAKFTEEIKRQVSQCRVLLAVIGPDWVRVQADSGRRRIDIASDLVRLEVAMALARPDATVIPVLAGADVKMPDARKDDLPGPLASLDSRNAIRLTFEQFDEDARRLIQQLEAQLGEPAQSHTDAAASTRDTGGADLLFQAETALRDGDWPAAARALQAAAFLPQASPEVLVRLRWVQWRYRLSQISAPPPAAVDEEGATWSDAVRLCADVKNAVLAYDDSLDRSRVETVCSDLMAALHQRGEPFPETEAMRILMELGLAGFYDLAGNLAGALIETDQDAAGVRRMLGMTMVEQNRIVEAVQLLEKLEADSRFDPFENNEVRGLLGKAYQRLYAKATQPARKRAHLEKAVQYFFDVFAMEAHPALWHGMSAAALLFRAKRDGIDLPQFPDPGALARVVIDTVERRDIERQADMWCFAAAAEASAGLQRRGEALRWTDRYVRSDYADRLELKRMQRHLEEVWEPKTAGPIVGEMLTLIKARMLESRHGQLVIDATEAQRPPVVAEDTLERVYAKESLRTLDWYRHGLTHCRSIARLERIEGQPFGTGFLMGAGDLHASLGDGMVLLTCAYMMSPFGGLKPEEIGVRFTNEPGSAPFGVRRVLWISPPEDLDTLVLELDRPADAFLRFRLGHPPPLVQPAPEIYLVGHAGGGDVSFSSGALVEIDETRLRYRLPTAPGSGGSPVFDAHWEVIAMHHLRRGDMSEGVRIDAVREAIGKSVS
jgi:hypothetical protein